LWLVEYDKFTQLDDAILKMVRGKNIPPVVIVANKADNENMVMESYSLPVSGMFDEFFPVSVVHNR
jgi:predicted GTPase